MDPRYLSNEDFLMVYGKVPRLNVDLVIKTEEGVLLALRSIEPYKGQWHLPGGTIYKGETIKEAARRVCKKETGLESNFVRSLGYMEFLNETRNGVDMHTVSIAVQLAVAGGDLLHDENAEELVYYKVLPDNVVAGHLEFLQEKFSEEAGGIF
jgi:ADP-ribose pyrophosphatase YjhB (NUDIX family)